MKRSKKYPIILGDIVFITGYLGHSGTYINNKLAVVTYTNTKGNAYYVRGIHSDGYNVVVAVCREQMALKPKEEYPELYI